MYASKHFKKSEFACKCGCGQNKINRLLVAVLEVARNRFNQPITIISGNRCVKHNAFVGGSENSSHLYGMGVDLRVKNVSPYEVYTFINSIFNDQLGLGIYPTHIHLDVRENKFRWDKRNI